jgi:uncharacterized Zn finger protein (UPF0148 family)
MSNTGKKDPAKEIGGYLLKGWTLLGESCPDCNVPLVEDKKRNAGVMLCVNCNKQYVREKDVEEGKFKVSSTFSGSAEPPKQVSTTTNNIKEEKDVAKQSAPAPHFNEDYYDDDDDWVPPTEEELKEIEAARKRNDEISAKLSQKLLQGWALIDIVCPACYTPLMRNKQKELFCVACDTLVIDQKEFDPKIHTAVNKDQLQNTPAAPTNNSASSSVNDNKAKQAQQNQAQQTIGGSTSVEKRDDAIQKRPEAGRSEQTEESSFVPNKLPRYESSEDVHSSKKTVDVTVKRLLTRLEDASARLETTDDLDKSKQLCSFIRECGSAIETMIAVQKVLQK